MTVRIEGADPRDGSTLIVTVEHGRVAALERLPSHDGLPLLVPGLIDLQVNGFAGLDINAVDVDADLVVELSRRLAQEGTTTYVPTIITAPETQIHRALSAIARARACDPRTKHAIPFVHLEGPHISAEDGPRGVHSPEHVRPPDLAEFRRWQEGSGGLVGLVTISPHHPGAAAYTSAVVASGARVAIGHTHASPDEIAKVAEAGATLSTHLGNGAHAVLPRHPNYLWTQLGDDRLMGCFIADGHHLPAETLRSMIRAKGVCRSALVSDSVALGGMPPGTYTTPVGGAVCLSADGRLSADGGFLAGATLPLLAGVRVAVDHARLTMADAVRLATVNPGTVVSRDRGRIEIGAVADLLLLSQDAESSRPAAVIVGGRPQP